MEFLQKMWVWVTGSLVGVFVFLRSLVIFPLRIRGQAAMRLLELLREKGKMFVLHEEMAESVLPVDFAAYCYLEGRVFFFSVNERQLQAGFAGVDTIATARITRWHLPWLRALLEKPRKEKGHLNVYILQPWDSQKIGSLVLPGTLPELYAPTGLADRCVEEIDAVLHGDRTKTGLLFYGPPGNGKTFTLRYFAMKYRMPIHIVALTKELQNPDLIRMFSRLKGPAMVLFEDFDAYFDKRTCLIERAGFTFDVILNVIDGVFSSAENIVFGMTANNIDKVDAALKMRPNRFRIVQRFPAPGLAARDKILRHGVEAVKATDGCTLDMCLFIRDRLKSGCPLSNALSQLGEQFPTEESRPLFMPHEEKVEKDA